MTPEGYKIVYDVLTDNTEIDSFEIQPQPQPGEDLREFEITIHGLKIKADSLLNALKNVGLMQNSNVHHTNPNAPRLVNFMIDIPFHTQDEKTVGFKDNKAAG